MKLQNSRPDDQSENHVEEHIEAQTIFDVLRASAHRHPDAPAIAAPELHDLSYEQLVAQVEKIVAALHALGVERGERIAIVLPNGPDMALAFLSVASCATAAPLNPAYGHDEFHFYLSDLNAKALIVHSQSDSPAIAAARELGLAIIEVAADAVAADAVAADEKRSGDALVAGVFALRATSSTRSATSANATTINATSANATSAKEWAQPDDIALVLHTSGTTSRPKIVPLTQRNLCASARNIASVLQLSSADRCLNVMPLFHIHGLMAATLATLSCGASVCCTPGFYAPRFFEWLQSFRPTWYSAVPTMHQAIVARAVEHQEAIARHRLRLIRSSSSALPPTVMEELEHVFGAPVIESYGMTEAAHQMASNPLPPRKRKPGSVGLAAGPDVAIINESGEILPRNTTGEVVIRGENVTPGYDKNPDANAVAFINGWFRTGDQGFLDDDDYLVLTGRLKEIINRGGEKISPREVDEVLLAHPAVAQAVAFAAPHAQLGEDVAAVVVLRNGIVANERELREYASTHLAHFKVPSRILFVEEIPKGATGKLQRIGLAEKLGLTAQTPQNLPEPAAYIAPRNPLEIKIAAIWQEVLGVERVGMDDNFFALGGDSMLATQTVARLRALHIDITLMQFFEAPTIAQFADAQSTIHSEAPGDDDIESLLAEIESLTDEEAQRQTR